jgi:hypothetical protein
MKENSQVSTSGFAGLRDLTYSLCSLPVLSLRRDALSFRRDALSFRRARCGIRLFTWSCNANLLTEALLYCILISMFLQRGGGREKIRGT